jgi:hypothetical protein
MRGTRIALIREREFHMTSASDPGSDVPVAVLVSRVRAEYREMPGLRLTMPQARRLWNVDEAHCQEVLATLVDVGFLRRADDGTFMKR